MIFPFVGYLVLFNDYVSEKIYFNNLIGENNALFLSSGQRLRYVYFGLAFLGISAIIYQFRRPFVLRHGLDQFKYANKMLNVCTVSTIIDFHGTIRHAGHFTLDGKYYDSLYESFLDDALGKEIGEFERDHQSGNWHSAKLKHEDLLRSIFYETYFRENRKRRASLIFCIILSLVGYAFLFIPSIDVFVQVTMSALFSKP